MNKQNLLADPRPSLSHDAQESSSENASADPQPKPSGTQPGAKRHLSILKAILVELLLGGAAVIGAIVVYRQGLLPILDAALQLDPELLSALRRMGIPLVAVLGYWAYVRWFEKRDVTELRLQPFNLLLGGLSGALLVVLPITLLFALGAYELMQFRGFSSALLGVGVLIVVAATLEELIYRCLLFRVLERGWGTGIALIAQSLVFALMHMGNLAQGEVSDVATMLVSVTLLGLLWSGVYVLTRNLWVAVANHACWNFTILLCGVPLSGNEDWRALAPFESRYAGPDWLTGGMFGPENSLLVILTVSVATGVLLRTAKRRGAFLKPRI
ncbi:CPBP family intramembrane glutamic endopeptidase [Bowmanella dokdonensis]|uniref:CPBP family intramembrane metalloprotease n=1 Tax=Bowmanella dokdonensis TaxID=751969 RepID=A0A939IPR0_9ALTE|nr:type II CAAX endopeptidase family protein [Bowmanella dokdonensis]MBN7826140.1 CPBP family intramembrane metalloprotease [Bowmanella dokdonensis]